MTALTRLAALASLGLIAASLSTGARAADAATDVVMQPAALRCVDFLPLADNTPLPEMFARNKFRFRDRAGVFAPFVNVFVDLIGQPVHGMQFDGRGLRVTPPKPALTATLRIGSFTIPGLTIEGLDASGAVQDTVFLPSDNIVHTVGLAAVTAPITLIQITGGGNEGVLNSVCTTP